MVQTTEGGRYPMCPACGAKVTHGYRTVIDKKGVYHYDCHIDSKGLLTAMDESHQKEYYNSLLEREREKREMIRKLGIRKVA